MHCIKSATALLKARRVDYYFSHIQKSPDNNQLQKHEVMDQGNAHACDLVVRETRALPLYNDIRV